jgi:flagellar biogenesis protein FliO
MTSGLQFFFAFVVVLVLIGAAAWLVRRFAGNRLGSGANRGRMPRLAVIDAAAVDGRRRLVLVRRDNVEHLLMIGGPSDIVVEPNIVRATPARDQAPARTPLPDAATWADNDPPRAESLDAEPAPEPAPPPPPRPARTAFPDDIRRAPPSERRVSDSLATLAPEPRPEPPPLREAPMREPPRAMPRAEPLIPRAPARSAEPAFRAAAPPPVRTPERAAPERPAAERPAPERPSQPSTAADQNLADMATRLEAALRRPQSAPRPAAPESAAVEQVGAPPVAPDSPAARTPRAPSPDIAPGRPRAAEEAKTADVEDASQVKAPFKNLEDEMASLLGRPKPPK